MRLARRRYERTKEEVGKWQPLVKAHREAPTLSFLAGRGDAGRPATTAALVAHQVPCLATCPCMANDVSEPWKGCTG